MRTFVAVVSLIGAAVIQAQAQAVVDTTTQNPNANNREFTLQRYAIGGRKSVFNYFYSLKPDCAPSDWLEVTIIKEPEHGTAKLFDGTTLPNYTAPNPRVKCNDKSIKAQGLEYVPTKGYAGGDQIDVEAIDFAGNRNLYTFNITVK